MPRHAYLSADLHARSWWFFQSRNIGGKRHNRPRQTTTKYINYLQNIYIYINQKSKTNFFYVFLIQGLLLITRRYCHHFLSNSQRKRAQQRNLPRGGIAIVGKLSFERSAQFFDRKTFFVGTSFGNVLETAKERLVLGTRNVLHQNSCSRILIESYASCGGGRRKRRIFSNFLLPQLRALSGKPKNIFSD